MSDYNKNERECMHLKRNIIFLFPGSLSITLLVSPFTPELSCFEELANKTCAYLKAD